VEILVYLIELALLGLLAVVPAILLISFGLILRYDARRLLLWTHRRLGWRRRFAEIAAGPVVLEGVWRRGREDCSVEEPGTGEHALVVSGARAPSIADGEPVLVIGDALRRAFDEAWTIDVTGEDRGVSLDPGYLDHEARRAIVRARVGSGLLALAAAVTCGAAICAWRMWR
jgi:hypothetical protein